MSDTERQDLYESITNKIISAIEAGTAPWQRPWQEVAGLGLQRNCITNAPYHGINAILLQVAAAGKYSDPRWLTFKMASDNLWKVRRHEKGHRICYFRTLEVEDPDKIDPATNKPVRRSVPVLKSYIVFNVEQLENGPPPIQAEEKATWQISEAANRVIEATGATIRFGGNRAYYSPSQDAIQLPPKAAFPNELAYLGTCLHELGHWTGHATRLARTFGRFGDQNYSREELRAEIASALLTAEIGTPGTMDINSHANYVANWLEVLRSNKFEIFRASADAQRIADFIMGRKPELKKVKDAAPMTSENQAWADDYSKAEQEEQGPKGFSPKPTSQRPHRQAAGNNFVLPHAPVQHNPIGMGSELGSSGP
ncbi:zincin-like metallopeptidase domain-containing protein [Rhodocyclaceae bacterium]